MRLKPSKRFMRDMLRIYPHLSVRFMPVRGVGWRWVILQDILKNQNCREIPRYVLQQTGIDISGQKIFKLVPKKIVIKIVQTPDGRYRPLGDDVLTWLRGARCQWHTIQDLMNYSEKLHKLKEREAQNLEEIAQSEVAGYLKWKYTPKFIGAIIGGNR